MIEVYKHLSLGLASLTKPTGLAKSSEPVARKDGHIHDHIWGVRLTLCWIST